VTYGSTFSLEFSSTTMANAVALVRLSSVTHSVNMDQRYVLLAEDVSPGGPAPAPAPSSPDLAPPGYYMLFVISADGVPSESALVQVLPGAPGDVDGDGDVDISDFLALLAAWGPCPDPCPPGCPADGDGDCAVGITDFLALLAGWS
jgi:hypothetical protein